MKKTRFSRREFARTSAGAVAAAGLVDHVVNPSKARAQSTRPLRIRTNRSIVSTDPGYMVGGFEMVLQFACLARLASYVEGDSWDWKPSDFVTSLEQVDPQTITFALRPGITWYDGESHEAIAELTAEDVKFSLERIKESEWKDKAVAFDHVEITGDHTGTIHLSQPFAPIFLTWLCDGTGTIVCKKRVEELGGTYDGVFDFYCGPYRVAEWVQKQRYVLELNPAWPGPAPGIADIEFIIIEDAKTAEIAFEADEIDITHTSTESLERLEDNPLPDSVMHVYAGTNWYWMGINTEHPKLADLRVRQAIQHAVDVEMVIDGAWAGIPARARGIVPPGLVGYRDQSKFETPDPDEARRLVADAGAEGLQLQLRTINDADRLAAAQIIQANLTDVGIEVEVVPMDPGPFWNLGLESEGDDWKDLQLWIMGYGDSPDPSQMTQWYVSDQVGVWNWERWSDPEYDALFQQGLSETDTTRRHEIYVRMQDIMEDTGGYVWLMFAPVGVLYRAELEPSIRPNGNLWYVQDFKWSDEAT